MVRIDTIDCTIRSGIKERPAGFIQTFGDGFRLSLAGPVRLVGTPFAVLRGVASQLIDDKKY
jgi:hypothetical protein